MTGDSLTASQQVSTPESSDFVADVITGLSSNPRTLPCKYFYDERGAALFQRICELPEYYITRTELDILDRNRGEIASQIGANVELIGLGTGAGIQPFTFLSTSPRSSCANRLLFSKKSFPISKSCRFVPTTCNQ